MPEKRKYIYGIVPNINDSEYSQCFENTGISTLSLSKVTAIVAERNIDALDFSSKKALDHQSLHHRMIVEDVMNCGFPVILPMKPGTFVKTDEEVMTILSKGHDLFVSSFSHIENMIEVDLTVTWSDFGSVLSELFTQSGIPVINNRIAKARNLPDDSDQDHAVRLVREQLAEKNRNAELRILDVLTSFSMDIRRLDASDAQIVSESAFLINRNLVDKFRLTVNQLEAEFRKHLSFKLSDPLPCYSFYTIEVLELNPEHIAIARKELGLSDEPSESLMKQAYIEYARLFNTSTLARKSERDKSLRIHSAYHTLLEYVQAMKQSADNRYRTILNAEASEKLFLVKMQA
jgi:hypothetical protein